MSEMVGRGSKYTDEQRREAAVLYSIHGHDTKVSRELDIPRSTITEWRKQGWWDGIIAEVRHEIQDQHIAKYHQITGRALDHAIENIGDLDAKAAVTAAAIATDKARLLLNQPTSIRGDSDTINSLKEQFEALASNHRTIEKTVVSDQ